jgi:geranylgeranyl diphosphate synthase, type II
LNAATLEQYLSVRRQEIEQALEQYLPKPPDCPSLVYEAMRYSLMAGGKRVRPVLTLASAEAIAAKHHTSIDSARTAALPAACAIEMIHTYSLIHDDLPAMDDDVLRRGRPTLHVVYGEGLAILAGDGLHAEAFALLAREPKGDDAITTARKLRVIELIAAAAGAFGMVGGQAIDLAAVAPVPGRAPSPPLDERALAAMHARKTGAIIRAAAMSGATMAGGDDDELVAIDRYASEIGLAFQIVDDILDVEGAAEALGKTAGKDAAAGKPTYPSLYGLERSRELADACLTRAQAALCSAALGGSRLAEIADWVVQRRS